MSFIPRQYSWDCRYEHERTKYTKINFHYKFLTSNLNFRSFKANLGSGLLTFSISGPKSRPVSNSDGLDAFRSVYSHMLKPGLTSHVLVVLVILDLGKGSTSLELYL